MEVHIESVEKRQKKVTGRKRRNSESYVLVNWAMLNKTSYSKQGNGSKEMDASENKELRKGICIKRARSESDLTFTSKNWGTHYIGQVKIEDDPFLFKMVEALHIKYRDARTPDATESDWMVCLHELLKKKKKDQDSLAEFVRKLRGSVKGEKKEKELLRKLQLLERRCIQKEQKAILLISADEAFFHDIAGLLDLTYSPHSLKELKRGFENGAYVQDEKRNEGTMMKTKFVYELVASVKGKEPRADLLKRLELLGRRCVEKETTLMSSSVGMDSPVGNPTGICSEQTPLPNGLSPLIALPWSSSSSSVRPVSSSTPLSSVSSSTTLSSVSSSTTLSSVSLSTTMSPDVFVNNDNNNIQEKPEVHSHVKKNKQKKYTRAQMRRRLFI